MGTLPNARHERFALFIVEGISRTKAYQQAGYDTNSKAASISASRLAKTPKIVGRIAELQAGKAAIHTQGVADAIEATSLSRQWIIENLMENVRRALQAKAVLDEDGQPLGEYSYNGMVANRALELLGKELGMFIDRKEIDIYGDLNRMSDGDLMLEVRRRAKDLAIDLEPLQIEDQTES